MPSKDPPPPAGLYGGKIIQQGKEGVEEVPLDKGGGQILWRLEHYPDGDKWLPYEHKPTSVA